MSRLGGVLLGVFEYDDLTTHGNHSPHNSRAGALLIHRLAWVDQPTGGSRWTPTVHWCPKGMAVGGSSPQHKAQHTVQKHGKHGSGDKSLLCYGGPRNEEPIGMIHEDFWVHVDSDWVGDLLVRKSTTGVIVRRGTEERALTSSENKITFETQCEIDEFLHSSINAEMLTIAARTHVDTRNLRRWCFIPSARLLRMLWRA